MQENKNSPLYKIDIVILIILVPLVFGVGYMSLSTLFMGSIGLLLPDWFFTIWGVGAILSFDALWVVITFKFWTHGNTRLKIFLTAMILTISASMLLSLLVVKGFAESMH
jgi:hypothetical protein